MATMNKASELSDYFVYEEDMGFVAVNCKYCVTCGPFPTWQAAWEYIEQNCKREAAEDASTSVDLRNELERERNGCCSTDGAR